jgi:hypothetical protein
MGWILPVSLLLFAGVVTLLSLVALVRRPTWTPRPAVEAEAFITTLAVIAAVWAGWVLLWLLEHRWWTLRVPRVIVRSWPRMTLRVPPARSPL